MNKLYGILCHITVILSLSFLVFLVLDQFNPMMNFTDNAISRWMLAALCAGGILQGMSSRREGNHSGKRE